MHFKNLKEKHENSWLNVYKYRAEGFKKELANYAFLSM